MVKNGRFPPQKIAPAAQIWQIKKRQISKYLLMDLKKTADFLDAYPAAPTLVIFYLKEVIASTWTHKKQKSKKRKSEKTPRGKII